MTTIPSGQLAYREYPVTFPHGGEGSLAFTLGDLKVDSKTSEFARGAGAIRYGTISVHGMKHSPLQPLIWITTATHLSIILDSNDPDPSRELQVMLRKYLGVFFKDIESFAPELAALEVNK